MALWGIFGGSGDPRGPGAQEKNSSQRHRNQIKKVGSRGCGAPAGKVNLLAKFLPSPVLQGFHKGFKFFQSGVPWGPMGSPWVPLGPQAIGRDSAGPNAAFEKFGAAVRRRVS